MSRDRLILAVDDDSHTLNLLRELCEASGFRVSTAGDGEEALEKIVRERPSLVLLDVMMPKKDGFSVLQAVRQTASISATPIIILTAMGDMDGKLRGMELGADDYVTKPFKLVELQTRINAALMIRDYRQRLHDAEEELVMLRAVDPLTGVGTYSQLKASLDAEIARARRYGRPAAALLLGLEDYQALRARLGREPCDALIAEMARAIRQSLRGADQLFRIDSDEFVVLLPETDLRGAHVTATRLSKVVAELHAIDEGKAGVKIRIGGAVFPHERVRVAEDLVREAHREYRALRETGPDKLVFDVQVSTP